MYVDRICATYRDINFTRFFFRSERTNPVNFVIIGRVIPSRLRLHSNIVSMYKYVQIHTRM